MRAKAASALRDAPVPPSSLFQRREAGPDRRPGMHPDPTARAWRCTARSMVPSREWRTMRSTKVLILTPSNHQAPPATALANSRIASARDARNADGEIGVSQFIGRRKSAGQSFDLKRNRMPKFGGESRGERGCAGDAHLLTKNRAYTQFEAIPGARDSQPGPRFYKLASSGSRLRLELIASGSASRSNMRRTRATTCSSRAGPTKSTRSVSVFEHTAALQASPAGRPAQRFCGRRRPRHIPRPQSRAWRESWSSAS